MLVEGPAAFRENCEKAAARTFAEVGLARVRVAVVSNDCAAFLSSMLGGSSLSFLYSVVDAEASLIQLYRRAAGLPLRRKPHGMQVQHGGCQHVHVDCGPARKPAMLP